MNRCIIPTANGPLSLTVPVVGGRDTKLPVKEVRIDDSTDWPSRHWRAIFSAYGRSPWFEYYREGLEAYYRERPEFLAHWNLGLLGWVYRALGHPMEIIPVYTPVEEQNPRDKTLPELPGEHPGKGLENGFRDRILPKNFQNPENFFSLPVYPQVFQDRFGFQPNMSIIDLIFCEGPAALGRLRERVS